MTHVLRPLPQWLTMTSPVASLLILLRRSHTPAINCGVAACGAVLGGYVADLIGRKMTTILPGLLMLGGSLVMARCVLASSFAPSLARP